MQEPVRKGRLVALTPQSRCDNAGARGKMEALPGVGTRLYAVVPRRGNSKDYRLIGRYR